MGITAGALAMALLAAGAESGQPHGLYVKLSGLWVAQQDSELIDPSGGGGATLDFNSGYGVVGGVGYTFSLDLPVSLSVELEYAFRSADTSSFSSALGTIGAVGTYDSHSVMVNAIAAVNIANGFGLYGAVGLGTTITTAAIEADLLGVLVDVPTEDDTTFTWQAMLGAQYAIGNRILVYTGVRYFDAGSPDLDLFGSPNTSFAVEAGLRVYF